MLKDIPLQYLSWIGKVDLHDLKLAEVGFYPLCPFCETQIRSTFAGEGLDGTRKELVAKFPETLLDNVSAAPGHMGIGGPSARVLLATFE